MKNKLPNTDTEKSIQELYSENPNLVTIQKAAKALKVSKDTLRRWEAKGKISSIRTTSGYRLYDLKNLIKAAKSKPETETPKAQYQSHPQIILPITTQTPLEASNIQDHSFYSFSNLNPDIVKLPAKQSEPLAEPVKKVYDFSKFSQPQNPKKTSSLGLKQNLRFYTLALALTLALSGLLSTASIYLPGFNQTKPAKFIAGVFQKSPKAITPSQEVALSNSKPEVLAVSSIAKEGKFLQLNLDTNIVGNLAVEGEGVFTENLTAPNILYSLVAGNNISITGDAQNPTISTDLTLEDATTTTKGIASFSADFFTVTAGAVSIANGSITGDQIEDGTITNSDLANTSITINAGSGLSGGGTVALGGSITISAQGSSTAGVTTITGTANQIIASSADGDVVLSLPQDIALTSDVEFDSLELTAGLIFNGATSGAVTLAAPSVVTSYTFTLPADDGSPNYVLQTDGSGNTSWVAQSGGGAGDLQGAYNTGNTIVTTTGRDISFTLASGLATSTSFELTNAGTANAFVLNDTNAASNISLDIQSSGTTSLSITEAGTLTTTGSISTSAGGTIYSDGVLTASNGFTMTTGALDITSTSGSVSSTGLTGLTYTLSSGTASITAPTLNLNTASTGNTSIGNATGTFSVASNGGLNVSTAGALTGVASIDTIAVSSTALTFAAGGTISATSGSLNLQTDGAVDVNIAGGSAATGCTITNSNGNLACSGTITSNGTVLTNYWDRTVTTLSPATAGDNITTSGNISTSVSGVITSAGTLTASNGFTQTTGAISQTATSGSISATGLTALTYTLSSGTAAITAPTLSLNTSSTGNTSIGNATGTFALTSSGGLNVSTAGALTGVASIDTIATSATAITFAGTGTVGATTTSLNLQADGVIDVNIAGGVSSTGCTVTNSSGNLACTGTITSNGTVLVNYWDRTGTTLSPATSGDNITTSGNISTSGTGTITSAGALTASNGFTQTTGALSLTSTSGAVSSTGLTGLTFTLSSGTAAITAPTLNLNTASTGNTAIGNSTGTFALTSNGGLNVSTAGALTGVASIDTIAVNATSLTFAGAGTISSTTTSAMTIDSGSTGTVNLGTGNNAKTINLGTGNAGNTINIGTNNTVADAINIGSALDTTILAGTVRVSSLAASSAVYTDGSSNLTTTAPTSGAIGYWSRTGTTLSPTTSGDNVTTSGNISTTGTGTITSAGLLTGSDGLSIGGTMTDTTMALIQGTSTATAAPGSILTVGGTVNITTATGTAASGAVLLSSTVAPAADVQVQGIRSITTFTPSVAHTTGIYGIQNNFRLGSTSSNITSVYGIYSKLRDNGYTGTLTNSFGLWADDLDSFSVGEVTNQAGLAVSELANATNNTLALLGTSTIPTGNYSIYSASAYQSYFAGNVGIGDSSPSSLLEVGNGTDSVQVGSTGDITFVDANDGASITGPAGGALAINAAATALNLQSDGSIDVNIAGGSGATGCTVANSTGNFTCAGSLAGSNFSGSSSGTNTGDQNLFSSIVVPTQTTITASSTTTALNVEAGSGVTLATDNTTKTLTISATGTGGDITAVGDVTSGAAFTSGGSGNSLYFNNNANVGQLTATTLSGTRTWTLPDASGTVCVSGSTCASSGTLGYWSRTGTTLSPSTSGDSITTSGDISTSGSGAITAAGTLTANGTFDANGQFDLGDGGDAGTISATTLDIDATGALQINSSGGAISIGNDAVAQNINIGTGAAARTLTLGNATSTTALNFTSGTGAQTFASSNSTGTTTSSAFVFNASSLTTGTALYVSSSATSGKTVDINASQTSGTVFNLAYGSAKTLSGDLTGLYVDLNSGNVDATNQNITGVNFKIPTVTDTHTSGTKTLTGMLVNFGSGAGINQNGAGGTLEYIAGDFHMPALTQTAGTLNAYGTKVTTPATITTGGTAYGNYISATGVGAGSLNGIGISGITGGAGTEYALNIGSGWDAVLRVGSTTVINGSGVTTAVGGGTGQSSYAVGDLLYADTTTTLAKRNIGNTNEVLTVIGGVPTWSTITGASCTNCVVTDPTADQTIAPTGQATTGLTVRQTSTASPTDDIFQITDSSGATKYFYVDKDGNVSTTSTAGQTLTLTPLTNTTALTLVGTNVTSQPLQYINSNNSSATSGILNMAYGAAQTLSGSVIGFRQDLSTNVTATNQSVTGYQITLPGATNTSGTQAYTGISISGGSLNENGGTATTFTGASITIPAITQTSGTLTAYGANVTTPSSITTAGTAYGYNVAATGVGAGTLYGLNISDITPGAGTEVGAQIGSGWDTNLLFNDTTSRVALANGGTLTILDTAGNSLCTITDSGSTGDLSCTGTISGSGSVGYWSRTGVTLSTATASDNVTIDGTTTANGTFDANGVFTIGDGGDTGAISATTLDIDATGALQINSSGGAISIGNDAVAQNINIGTGAAARTVTIGNSTSTTALAFNSGTGSQTFTSQVTTGTTTTSAFVFDATALNSGTGSYFTSDSITTGKLLQVATTGNTLTSGTLTDIRTTSTALTGTAGTGSLVNLDWTPGSSTTATGDLFALNIGANGSTTGNLFNILDSGSSIFSVSETSVTTSLPANFTSPGDVSIAYDLNFTNPVASYIKSYSALTIQPGDPFGSSNLTLSPYNEGSVYIPSNVATGYGVDLEANLLSSGAAMRISSSSTAGTGSAGISYLLALNRSGANSNASHVAFGIVSTVTNTGTTSTNYGGYFLASGATNNYGLVVAAGNVGIGDTTPSSLLEIGDGTDSLQVGSAGDLTFVDANGAASITGPAGGALGISAANSQALNLTTTTAGNISLNPAGVGDITLVADNAATSYLNISGLATGTATNALCQDSSGNVITCTSSGSAVSGTSGQVAFFNGANSVTSESSGFGWDATNNYFTIDSNVGTTYGAGAGTGLIDFASTSLTTGTLLNLELTEGTLNGGHYLKAWDATGSTTVFSIGEDGVTTIAGVAASNVFTITAGDAVMSDGSLTITDADNAASFSLTNNSATTADISTFSGTALTTGSLMTLTGPSAGTAGLTDSLLKLTSDIGNTGTSGGLALLNATVDTTGASQTAINLNVTTTNSNSTNTNTAYGVFSQLSDSTSLANTNIGISGSASSGGNAAKTLIGVNGVGTSVSTTADNVYGVRAITDVSGIITSGTREVYGVYSLPIEYSASTGGTTNLYGVRSSLYADGAAGSTYNGYSLYVANGTFDTDGTTRQIGLALEPLTGADTNIGICFDCDGTFGTSSVASGIQWGTDANSVSLYRSASDVLRTGDSFTVDLDLTVSGTLNANGPVNLGNATGDTITFTGYVGSSILPSTDDTYDLGDDTHRWRDLYLGGETLHIGTSTTDEGRLSYTTSSNTLLLDNVASGAINFGNVTTNPTYSFLGSGTFGTSTGANSLNGDTTVANTKNFLAGQTTGKIGFGGAVSGSDYLMNIALDSTQDWARGINITQANNVDEDSAVIAITNTANVGTATSGRTTDNLNLSLAPTATSTNISGGYNARGIVNAIDTSGLTLGNSSSAVNRMNVRGEYISISGTPVINNTNADEDTAIQSLVGSDVLLAITPTLTAATDVAGSYIAGSFNSTVSSAGNAGFRPTVYGLSVTSGGDLTTTGTTAHYGGAFTTSGTADTNYGLYTSATGATTNYALYVAAGNATFADGTLLDLSAINNSSATEGLILPQLASACAAATAEGQVCWDTAGEDLYVGNGTTAVQMNGGGGSSAWNALTDPTGDQTLAFGDGEQNIWTVSSDTETFWSMTADSMTTGDLFDISLDGLTTGTGFQMQSTSTALTGVAGTGSLMNLEWAPGSSTLATGDLFALNIGANGSTTGNIFNLLDSGSSIFSVSETAFTTSLPSNFTAPGDTSMAYDLNFTNPTAAYIKSAAPLAIVSGETFNSSNLTLGTYNEGTIALQTNNITTTAVDLTNSTITTGTGMNLNFGAITTGTGLAVSTTNNTLSTGTLVTIASSSTAQTSGGLLSVVQSGVTTGFTGDVMRVVGSGTTGSGGTVLSVTGANTTAGTVLEVVGNTVTTTNGRVMTVTANALTSGIGVNISSSSNITSGNLVNIAQTGTTTQQAAATVAMSTTATTNASARLLTLTANSMTAGTVQTISSTTTAWGAGTMFGISKTGATGNTAFTGDIANITYSHTFNSTGTLDHTGNTLDMSRTLSLTGAATQTVSGANLLIADSLTVNNASGTLTYTAPTVSITRAVTRTSGAITNSGNLMTLTSSDASHTGNTLSIADSATHASGGSSLLITASAITSGAALTVTGPTATGVTSNFVNVTTDVGSAGSALRILPDFSGSAVTGYGLRVQGVDSTSAANTDYAFHSDLDLTNNAAKLGYAIYGDVSTTSTTGDTTVGVYGKNTVSTGFTNAGTRLSYGAIGEVDLTGVNSGSAVLNYAFGGQFAANSTGAHSAGINIIIGSAGSAGLTSAVTGSTNAVYGVYAGNPFGAESVTVTSGTVAYTGLHIQNPTMNTTGTTTKYGILIEDVLSGTTDADTNYAIYSAGGQSYFAGAINVGDQTSTSYSFEIYDNTTNYAASISNMANATNSLGLNMRAGNDTSGTFVDFRRFDNTPVGSITFSGGNTTAYNTTSDRRLKTGITETNYGLEDLLNIEVSDYKFINDNSNTPHTGFIAQDLYNIYPEAVTVPSSDDRYWMVDYGKITPLIVKSVQELNHKVENALLTINPQGQASSLNVSKITVSGDVTVGGIVKASDYSLNASDINRVGVLASLPVDQQNRATVTDTLNLLAQAANEQESRIADLQAKEASTAAAIADAQILGEQALDQTASLQESVASTSSTIANLSSQIEELFASITGESSQPSESSDSGDIAEALTPPTVMFASDSATLDTLTVNSQATISGQLTAYEGIFQNTLKSLGETFLGQTNIAGDLSVDGTFSVSEGSKVNALPILYFQTSALAEAVDFFNGLVTITKDGAIAAKEIITEQISVKADSSAGTVVLAAGESEMPVLNDLVEGDSIIILTSETPGAPSLAVADKVEDAGFVVKLGAPYTQDIKFSYLIVGQK